MLVCQSPSPCQWMGLRLNAEMIDMRRRWGTSTRRTQERDAAFPRHQYISFLDKTRELLLTPCKADKEGWSTRWTLSQWDGETLGAHHILKPRHQPNLKLCYRMRSLRSYSVSSLFKSGLSTYLFSVNSQRGNMLGIAGHIVSTSATLTL